MLRGLIHHWRLNVAVALAAAVATAVLTGALMVGDSVRGSLRDLTLQRLGRVDEALLRDRFFDADLVERFVTHPEVPGNVSVVAPLVLVRASLVHADSGARASGVQLQGIDERFDSLLDWPGREELDLERAAGQSFPSIVLNEKLASEIGAVVGDGVLVSFERYSDVPRDTLLGEKDPSDVLGRLRVTVKDIVPDEGGGRFSLVANQVTPFNAFVELGRLQRALELKNGVNTLLVARPGDDAAVSAADAARLDATLAEVVILDDLGLIARRQGGVLSVESKEFVLRPRLVDTLLEVAADQEMPVRTALSYLANRLTAGERSTPYSTVAAVEPLMAPAPFLPVSAVRGDVDGLAAGDILLNTWAAEDLDVEPGDEVSLTYFAVGPREELLTREQSFRVRGVVAMEGLGADATLTPDYPGIADADDISAWDPPFPVDLDAVRPKDEDYWDEWRAVPKAFVQPEEGRRLWGTRHGEITAVRVAVGDDAGEARFRDALRAALDPVTQGFRFQPVKADGLGASVGATNFGEYFSYFSFFIIVSAALLVGLLFRLGVEQRGREVGLLLAVGTPLRTVRRRLLAEGTLVAVVGGLLGALGGWGYAWLMMVGLRTVWVGAVGTPVLFLHVVPATLAAGLVGALVVVVVTQWLAIGGLRRIPTPMLLAGSVRSPRRRVRGAVSRVLAPVMTVAAVGMLGAAVALDRAESVGLTVGAGFALLIGGLAWFAWWCRRGSRGSLARGGAVLGMAARNSAWNPGRSILSVILVASACFLIVLVGAFRHEFGSERLGKESGTGGFALMAESTVPIHGNLDRAADRLDLGVTDGEAFVPGVSVFPLRMLPGNDTSCLNLYEPDKPRVLGVGREVIERGGFTFQATIEETDNPWSLLEDLTFGPGVIPAVADAGSAQWIWKLGLGDDVIVENEFGEELRLRLVGLVQKSIFQSEILVFEDDFLDNFPTRGGYGAFLIDAPPGTEDGVAEALEAGLDRYGFDAVSTVRRLADFQAVENTYMSTFQMLGGLGLLLGTVGLGIVLLRNVIERRGELATLRAFGYRRRRIAWIVVAENGFLLLVGLGIGALSALLSVSPRLLAGTLHLPWGFLGGTLSIIFVVGMVSCTAAVQGALRVPLLAVLKSDT